MGVIILIADKKQRKQYDKASLINAYEEVKAHKLTITTAAKKYAVPRSTLADHVKGRVTDFKNPGIDRMLTNDEEQCLVEYISYMQRHFMPLRRDDIRGTVLVGKNNVLFFQYD